MQPVTQTMLLYQKLEKGGFKQGAQRRHLGDGRHPFLSIAEMMTGGDAVGVDDKMKLEMKATKASRGLLFDLN